MLLVRCGDDERWAGLWDFPRVSCDRADASPTAAELTAKVRERTGIVIMEPRLLTTIRHTVTRFRITLECFAATAGKPPRSPQTAVKLKWLRRAELADCPLNSTGRKLAQFA